MSKNFEQEYKEHIANEVPDLWAGIEARLPEKKNPKVVWWRNSKVLGSVAALVVLIGSAAVYMNFYPLTGLGNAMSEAPAADSAADAMPNDMAGATNDVIASADDWYPSMDDEIASVDQEVAVMGDAAEGAVDAESPAEQENFYESMSDKMNAWNDTDLNIWDAEMMTPEHDKTENSSSVTGLEFEFYVMVDDVWMKNGETYYHVTLQENMPVWELVAGEGITFCAAEEFMTILECDETYWLRVANYEASENDRGSLEDYKIVGWRK